MESSQLNLNQTNIPECEHKETPHQNSEIVLTEAQARMEKQIEDGFNYILTILNIKFQNISAIVNASLNATTKLDERVANLEKTTDATLKMQDKKSFMDTLLQNSKKDTNVALNSLYANNCQELKTILQFASYDTKWAYELKSILSFNKKYFYADINPLAASLRKSCKTNDHKNLQLSSIVSEKKIAKELDYDKKAIIEDIVTCITEATSAEIYNTESKKILDKLCNDIQKTIKEIFGSDAAKTNSLKLSTREQSNTQVDDGFSEEKEIVNEKAATIDAIEKKIVTIASAVSELQNSHNELRASLQEDAQKK